MQNIIYEIVEIKDGFLTAIEQCGAIKVFNHWERKTTDKLVIISEDSKQIVAKVKQFEDFLAWFTKFIREATN